MMRQLPLPGLETPGSVPPPDSGASAAAQTEPPAAHNASETEPQLWLFSGPAVLLRELESAVEAGDFESASVFRGRLEAECGPSPLTRRLQALDRLHGDLWSRTAGEILDTWAGVDSALADHPWLRKRLRLAALARALRVYPAAVVVKERPWCLAVLCNTLRSTGSTASACCLVRDALLSERALDPLEFEDDAVRDVLADDREPTWLASLGAIRRVWPLPPPSAADLVRLEDWVTRPDTLGVAEPEAARVFWLSLKVANSEDTSGDLVLEARKAMKRLDAGLHGLYMAHLRPR